MGNDDLEYIRRRVDEIYNKVSDQGERISKLEVVVFKKKTTDRSIVILAVSSIVIALIAVLIKVVT